MSELIGRRIIVTGGAGFIGSEVVAQLSMLGSRVTVFDNLSSGKTKYIDRLKGVKLFKGDVCNSQQVERALRDKEIVIHLAALPFIPDSYYRPMDFFRANTTALSMFFGNQSNRNLWKE